MDNYDTPWKTALMRYFPDFMAFYFPAASKAIDWDKPPKFLDQELRQVCRDARCGARRIDKLVEVTALAGGQRLLYVHIEIQRSRDSNFCERVFTYHYRLYDRFRCPIASMAILADDSQSWRPSCFSYESLGCTAALHFPIAKLIDFAPLIDELPSIENPFALVTAAHLMTLQTIHAPSERHLAKTKLVRLLFQHDWPKEQIGDLLDILQWFMYLPRELESQFRVELDQIERERSHKMKHVMSFTESLVKEGETKGRIEGHIEGRRETLSEQLRSRFGPLPDEVQALLGNAGKVELKRWAAAFVHAHSLDEIFQRR